MATQQVTIDDTEEDFVPPVKRKGKRKAGENRNQQTENWLDERGLKGGYAYEQDMPLSAFDFEESQRNQARNKAIDPDLKDRYVIAWKNGETFPPVIAHNLNGKLIIVDGNHRLAAAEEAGVTEIDTYIIHRASDNNIISLTYEANVRHGQATAEPERVRHAVRMVRRGAKPSVAARNMNVSVSKVTNLVREMEAEDRISELNINIKDWNELHVKIRLKLHSIALNDVFREAYKLTRAASLSQNQVNQLVQAILDNADSVAKQIQVIEEAWEQHREQIDEHAGGVFGRGKAPRNTARGQVWSAIGLIRKWPENLNFIANEDMQAHERQAALEKIDECENRLRQLRQALSISS